MRIFRYDGRIYDRFGQNEVRHLDALRFEDYTGIESLADDSYFVPSTEAVKRIGRANGHAYKGLYDSDASLEAGIEPSYARHPSRDIVELVRFNERMYARIEEALKLDLTDAQRRTLEKQKNEMDKVQKTLQVLQNVEKQQEVSTPVNKES